MATWRIGERQYTTDLPWDGSARLEVHFRVAEHSNRDRFDVATAAQRERFAVNATAGSPIPAERVADDLLRVLDAVRNLVQPDEASPAPVITVPSSVADDLRAADLLNRCAADATALGWVGEERLERLVFLCAISRKCTDPVWALLDDVGYGLHPGLGVLATLTPPEDLVHASRLTDAALYHHDPDALRHRLILVDAGDTISAEVATALRVLQARGALSQVQTQRGVVGAAARRVATEIRGPIAVLTGSTRRLDCHLQAQMLPLRPDTSPEQTALVLAASRRQHGQVSGPEAERQRRAIQKRQHAWQRALRPLSVRIPFAERIVFPVCGVQSRLAQDRFLGLIAASALLHQHQRPQVDGGLLADETDFHLVVELLADTWADLGLGRSDRAQDLLDCLHDEGLTTASIPALQQHLPGWTRYAFRAAFDELVAEGLLLADAGGRGRRARCYTVVGDLTADPATVSIHLRDATDPDPNQELATIGETGLANLSGVWVSA